ncbi:hypothetical protein NECAME_15906 [Necator americanus]|uniref:RRM domain-containing protein n=1 Tax=Necator americanus TaxID=51031 RepID=W2SFA2_NECAM|nr:hypothetical protein NECAME_15906 [Necator americanus]ETN68274.1 hypothetical protein NECAME_15906 [Necator americanus]
MGAWAEIMAEEQVQTLPQSEKKEDVETQEQSVEENDAAVRKQPEQQYFAVQVTNLPACTNEELFYHFGGDSIVRDIAFLPDRRCAARIDLFTIEGLKRAKELDGQQFRGRTLRVYEIREDRVRERPIQHDFQNRQYSHEPPPYSRESSRYNSQSSLYSNDARNYDRGNRSFNSSNDYRNSNQYRGPMGGTFPRGKYFNAYDEYNNMGRYVSGSQPYRGGGPYYNHQYNGGGYPPRPRGVQGRGGYSGGRGITMEAKNYSEATATIMTKETSQRLLRENFNKPNVRRSRTESTAFDAERRRMELSRTSSRLSTSTEDVDNQPARVVPKKLTNKDIFGEAKPVDTSERLREIEAKQERERLLEEQKYKEEAEAARLAAAAEHNDNPPPIHHPHQYAAHHGHVAHHNTHHQYHHAPSRQGLPPHAPYVPYQTSHNIQQHSQQPHPNTGQYHPQQRYDGGVAPGGYRIMRRESADATDASPPLDPVHAKAPLQTSITNESEKSQETTNENTPSAVVSSGDALPPTMRRNSVSDRRRPNDSMSSSGTETLPRPAGKVLS